MIKIHQTIITSLFDQQVLCITNLARPSFMDIIKTDWDAYEAQLADNMTNLTDSFSNLDSSDKVDKAADLLSQSVVEAFNSATDFTYVS